MKDNRDTMTVIRDPFQEVPEGGGVVEQKGIPVTGELSYNVNI